MDSWRESATITCTRLPAVRHFRVPCRNDPYCVLCAGMREMIIIIKGFQNDSACSWCSDPHWPGLTYRELFTHNLQPAIIRYIHNHGFLISHDKSLSLHPFLTSKDDFIVITLQTLTFFVNSNTNLYSCSVVLIFRPCLQVFSQEVLRAATRSSVTRWRSFHRQSWRNTASRSTGWVLYWLHHQINQVE